MIGRAGEPPVPPLTLVGDFGGGGMLLAFGIVCGMRRGDAVGPGAGRRRRHGRRRRPAGRDDARAPRRRSVGRAGHEPPRQRRVVLRGLRDRRRPATSRSGAIDARSRAELLRLTGLADDSTAGPDPDRTTGVVAGDEGAARRGDEDEDPRRVVRAPGGNRRLLRPRPRPRRGARRTRTSAQRGTFTEVGGVVQPAPGAPVQPDGPGHRRPAAGARRAHRRSPGGLGFLGRGGRRACGPRERSSSVEHGPRVVSKRSCTLGSGSSSRTSTARSPTPTCTSCELGLGGRAEPAGFDSVWVSEHHFSDYQLTSQQSMVLSWLAGQTTRVKLGTFVTVLPVARPGAGRRVVLGARPPLRWAGHPRSRPGPRAEGVRRLPGADGRVAPAVQGVQPGHPRGARDRRHGVRRRAVPAAPRRDPARAARQLQGPDVRVGRVAGVDGDHGPHGRRPHGDRPEAVGDHRGRARGVPASGSSSCRASRRPSRCSSSWPA